MSNSLTDKLRKQLAKVTLEARERADQAVRAALENLAVHEKDYRRHMTVPERELRNRLRAKGRALGDERNERAGTQEIEHLAEQAAYEHWHRLLFTRFLVENDLLYSDESFGSVPVSLQECDELAQEAAARDGFDLACRFASGTLPEVFRQDDPVLELRLAPNDESALRKLLDSLPRDVFRSDDGLGWTYQFWQTQRKDEVNASGKKIGADELPAVTQLFTEDYMVEFLLHNTLGAWWAGKLGPIRAANEGEARAQAGLRVKDGLGIAWNYLRFVQDKQTKTWSPAAGTFAGWPTQAKLITCLDPCMGSGHFVVFALPLVARMRMQEEPLSAAQAIHATLRDNAFGLELDERCAQIAAFNVALTAWKLGGYQPLPPLHLACSGLGPHAAEKDWVSLAGDNGRLQRGMERLHALFKDAPVLGSLINPRALGGDLVEADFHELQPLLEKALAQETKDDDTAHEMAVTAHGLAKAAEILAGQFTLVATNVPYLGRGKQDEVLQDYCEWVYPRAKTDLATTFVERCLDLCSKDGSAAIVTPQNWLFLASYKSLREDLLKTRLFNVVARLGAGGFQTPMWDFNVALVTLSRRHPEIDHRFVGLDVGEQEDPSEKASALQTKQVAFVGQNAQFRNPDSKVMLGETDVSALLASRASSFQGIKTGGDERVRRCFWEVPTVSKRWRFYQSTVDATRLYGGLESIIDWFDDGEGLARRQGMGAWGKRGVMVSQMGQLPVALFCGDAFDSNASPIIPKHSTDLPALWTMCSSSAYSKEVRRVDQSLKPTNTSLVQVPFDLAQWQKVAAAKYPHGLPKPFSSDPTQWLFNGHPKGSDEPLHVAVARLLGYQWPRQTGSSFPDCPALGPDGLEKRGDEDGIVCLAAINREQPAAHRLRETLGAALGKFDERALLSSAGAKGSKATALEDWLRDEFFEQHCDRFHQRPFIWHIWDGRKDGFHVLVNYHNLDHAKLKTLG